MAQTTKYAVVDDEDDTSIHYSAGWVQEIGTMQDFSANGVPFQNTLHRISQNGSLSFEFYGSNIIVWGFNPGVAAQQADWRCIIDGTEITPGTPVSVPTNNWYLCGDNGLLNHATGFHTLTIDVASISPNSSLWLDWVEYIPQPGYAFDASDGHSGASMLVETNDPMIQFGNGWVPWADSSNITWGISSEVTIDFIGTSLSWFGTFYSGDPGVKGQGSYSVDGLPDVTFNWSSQPANLPRQLFFDASNLSFGSHKVVVKYLGPTSSNSTPLIMDYIVIGNASVPQDMTSPFPISPSISPSPSVVTSDSGRRTGIIVGATIGSALTLVSLILLLLLKHRRKRPDSKVDSVIPFPHNLMPQVYYSDVADPSEAVHLIPCETPPLQSTYHQPHQPLEGHRDDTSEVNEPLPEYTEIES